MYGDAQCLWDLSLELVSPEPLWCLELGLASRFLESVWAPGLDTDAREMLNWALNMQSGDYGLHFSHFG